MHYYEVPNNVNTDHGNQHCTTCTNKEDIHRSRLTVGGDKVHYDSPVTHPTAEQP